MILDLRRRQALAQARRERANTEEETALPIQVWADRNIMLPRGSGMTPHDSNWTPYWQHWLEIVRRRIASEPNATGDHLVETIDLVTGTQVGKTQGFLLVILAWIAALFPRDTAVVLPLGSGPQGLQPQPRQALLRAEPTPGPPAAPGRR